MCEKFFSLIKKDFNTNKLAFQSPSLQMLKEKLASNKTPEEAYYAIGRDVKMSKI
jgi:hypothetical protein